MSEESSVLTCWKDIATHLGKTVRTVQRWERELGMPVHRPKGPSAKVVCAFPDELARWIATATFESSPSQPLAGDALRALLARLEGLIAENEGLSRRCAATLRGLEASCTRLRVAAAEALQQIALERPSPAPRHSHRRSPGATPSNGRARLCP